MSVRRHCSFYPTLKGWYMDLAHQEDGGLEDCSTYGPTDSLQEIRHYLGENFSNPGGSSVTAVIVDVPAISPNGDPVTAVMPSHRSDWDTFGAPLPRFLTCKDDVRNYTVYDTASDLGFFIPNARKGQPRQIESVFAGRAWMRSPHQFTGTLVPATAERWIEFARQTIADVRKAGWTYVAPIIIPGLSKQPVSIEALSTL